MGSTVKYFIRVIQPSKHKESRSAVLVTSKLLVIDYDGSDLNPIKGVSQFSKKRLVHL